MRKYNDTYIFEDDDEFYEYNVAPRCVLQECGNYVVQDVQMTPFYDKAIEDGCSFYISDPDSKVMNRGTVNVGPCTKKVKNLDTWFVDTEKIENKYKDKDATR